MTQRKWLKAAFAGVLIAPLTAVTISSAAAAQTPSFTAQKIQPGTRYSGDKTPSSRLAQTDPSLLGRTDSAPVAVVVKLDVDSVSTYTGGVSGYAATSPAVTGKRLSNSSAERNYEGYLAGKEDAFLNALHAKVPNAKISQRLRTVYGGVATVVPANQINDLLRIPGVSAVQKDDLRQPLTTPAPSSSARPRCTRSWAGPRTRAGA